MEGRLMKAFDGKRVRYGRNYTIDVTILSEGLYFISAEDNDGNEFHKQMVIKR
jgi:hypothetical protein